MRKAVLTDVAVLAGWPKSKKPIPSAKVADALKLHVFQVTARLAGMEKRGLLQRDKDGLWSPTGKEAQPEPERIPRAPRVAGGPAVPPPDDSKVPRVKKGQWVPSEKARSEAAKRVEEVRGRIEEYSEDKKRYKRELAALHVELDHCEAVLAKKAKGCWSHRLEKNRTVYISPDGKEYVPATNYESAHLLVEAGLLGPVRLRLAHTSRAVKQEIKKQGQERERQQAKQEDTERRKAEDKRHGKTTGKLREAEKERAAGSGKSGGGGHGQGRKVSSKTPRRAQKEIPAPRGREDGKVTLPRRGSRERYAALGRS